MCWSWLIELDKSRTILYMKPTCTRNHRINQVLHKRLDWKCKQCFRDQNSVKQKTTGNRYTGNRPTLSAKKYRRTYTCWNPQSIIYLLKIIIDNNSNVENSNDDNVNNNNNNKIIMLRTSERITVYMYKSPELCWSVNTFSTVRRKSNNICGNVYQNTINDDDSQTSFSPIIFLWG